MVPYVALLIIGVPIGHEDVHRTSGRRFYVTLIGVPTFQAHFDLTVVLKVQWALM